MVQPYFGVKYWSIANSEALGRCMPIYKFAHVYLRVDHLFAVDSVQIFLCNVSIVTTTVEVSAITRRPFKKNALPAVDVLWKNWSFRDYPATAHNSMLNLVSLQNSQASLRLLRETIFARSIIRLFLFRSKNPSAPRHRPLAGSLITI